MSSLKRFIADKVHSEVQKYMIQHNVGDYSDALRKVLEDDPALKRSYADVPDKTPEKAAPAVSSYVQKKAGDRINELVVQFMAEQEDACSYSQALRIVLSENPTLAKEYLR